MQMYRVVPITKRELFNDNWTCHLLRENFWGKHQAITQTSSKSSLSACRWRSLDLRLLSTLRFSCCSVNSGFSSSQGSMDCLRVRNSCLRMVKFSSIEASLCNCFCMAAIIIATVLASLVWSLENEDKNTWWTQCLRL